MGGLFAPVTANDVVCSRRRMQRGTSPGWFMHRADVFRKAPRAGRETRVTLAGRETSCGQFTAPQSENAISMVTISDT